MGKRIHWSVVRAAIRCVMVVLLCGLMLGEMVPSARGDGVPTVVVSPGTVGSAVNMYSIVNVTFASNVLPGSTLVVTFDGSASMTFVPSSIAASQVLVNGTPAAGILTSGQTVTVVTPSSMQTTTVISLVFQSGAGIYPVAGGTHWVTVSTSGAGSQTILYTVAGSGIPTATAVSFSAVTIADPAFGKASGYQFTFTSGVNLFPGSTISLQFPAGFTLPAVINGINFGLAQGSVIVSSFQGNLNLSGNTIVLTIPTASGGDIYSYFAAGVPITIKCGPYTGITNPAVGGTYQFRLWTSLQTMPATASTTLGSGVVNLSATVTPAIAGSNADYQLSFATSPLGILAAGTDKITIAFPTGFALPATIPGGTVKVNGIATTATVSGQNLVIAVPAVIAASGTVVVDVGTAVGIRTGTAGNYQLGVTTSADQLPVQTNAFTVTASVVSGITVAAVPAVKSAAAAYTVSFTTGAGGTLKAGDSISLFLPYGFVVPSAMTASQVMIKSPATASSGISPATVTCSPSTQSIVLALPSAASIAGGSTIAVSLPAVITNPAAGGSFTAKVSTSRETTAVESQPFTIYANPVSTLKIAPASPDGRNGVYVTQPSFTISVDGPSGVTLSAFYKIDSAASFTSYNLTGTPSITVPQGTHTVTSYAQDSLGNVEPVHTQQFTVDLTDPVITVSSPAQKAVVVQATTVVTGKVACLDPSSAQLTVNGQTVAVAADGSFSTPVTFSHEGDNTITLTATSASGRTKTMTLTVNYIARVTMSLAIGSTTINMNNEFKTIEAAPYISRKGVTMVPLRFISEAFKATVAWDPVFKAVTIDLNGKTMRIQVGYLSADVNGKSFALQDAPAIVKGRTFVPLRFIAENFGARVDWNAALKTVNIVYPKP